MHQRNDIGTVRRLMRHDGARARQGFTLIELIVAIALFITIMAGVGLVFVAAVRSMRIGFQVQEAFEVARGALGLMERDLTRVLTSRDHGDNHNFYGTPIGFSFIGLTSPNQGGTPNVARITYVMYDTENLPFVDSAAADAPFDRTRLQTIDEQQRRVFALLRFVEPGVSNLESFPVDWANVPVVGEFPGVFTLQDLIGDPLDPENSARLSAVFMAVDSGLCDPSDLGCLNEVVKARKRELWIKMLAADDLALPNFWQQDLQNPLNPLNPFDLPNPLDYVVAENILFVANNVNFRPQISDIDEATISNVRPPFFTYRKLGERIRLDPETGDTLFRVDPITGEVLFIIDPTTGQPLLNNDGEPIRIPQTERAPLEFAFWNDTRNMDLANNGIDDDGDGFIDEANEGFGVTTGPGSPLSPRLPLDVAIRFTLFFESPYVGAPDFVRTFNQRIDLPTGFARGL